MFPDSLTPGFTDLSDITLLCKRAVEKTCETQFCSDKYSFISYKNTLLFNDITNRNLCVCTVNFIYIMTRRSYLWIFHLLFLVSKLADEDTDGNTEAAEKATDTTKLKEDSIKKILSF